MYLSKSAAHITSTCKAVTENTIQEVEIPVCSSRDSSVSPKLSPQCLSLNHALIELFPFLPI